MTGYTLIHILGHLVLSLCKMYTLRMLMVGLIYQETAGCILYALLLLLADVM